MVNLHLHLQCLTPRQTLRLTPSTAVHTMGAIQDLKIKKEIPIEVKILKEGIPELNLALDCVTLNLKKIRQRDHS